MLLSAIIFILACEAVGILSATWSGTGNSAWYKKLRKPSWQPPSRLFGPVWTVLYALMGFAAYTVYALPASPTRTVALSLFAFQLVLNFFWTPLFFRYHVLALATVEIVVMLLAIIATIIAFAGLSTLAAWLLVPYALWVSFATALSATIWHLNRTVRK